MKAVVITIPEQPQRTAVCRERVAIAGLDAHFVQGINGEVAGLRTDHTYESDTPGAGYKIGPKTIGIFLSHYIAWSVILAIPDEYVLVLEDDAVFPDDFQAKLNKALLDVPTDWDVLFLGSCCTEGHPAFNHGNNIQEVKWPQCLHAYILTQNAANTLVRKCRDVNGPIDCVLKVNEWYGLKVYCVLPRIVDQFETVIPP